MGTVALATAKITIRSLKGIQKPKSHEGKKTMLAPTILSEIERRALEIAAELDVKEGKRIAEVIPGIRPEWHMLRTMSGKEEKAAMWLSKKGIGVFVPRFDKGSVLDHQIELPNGRFWIEKIDVSNRLIFPGRVFVFVWDILAHWRRIKTCHNVLEICVDGANRPVIVPDPEIDRIQVLQFSRVPSDEQKRKKKRKRYRSVPEGHVATMSTRSFWKVDGGERNHVLDRALGLAS